MTHVADVSEMFCLDEEGEPDLPQIAKKRNRLVGYLITFLVTLTLGTTEIFASWYISSEDLGGSGFLAGFAMGSFGLVYMVSPSIGGKISDRIGRKKSLFIATVAYIAVLVLYPLGRTPIDLIIIRALEGIVYGFIAPSIEGMVAELSPESQAVTLGNFSTSWSAGMIVSPFLIGYVTGLYGVFSSIYVIIAVEFVSLGIIGGLLQKYRMKTTFREARKNSDKPRPIHSKTSARFIASYLSIGLWGVVSTVILALLPRYVEGLGYATEDFGNLLMIWNGVRTFAFILCARLPERTMGSVIISGAVLSGISSLMVYAIADIWVWGLAMAISGAAVGFSYLGALFLIVSATEDEKGGHAGLVESMGGVGLFLGPIVGGWFMDNISAGYPFLLCAVLSFVVLLFMIPLFYRSKKRPEK
ncbi:MAG: MFS transporter [Candidatus Odinarchaeota archaeon]